MQSQSFCWCVQYQIIDNGNMANKQSRIKMIQQEWAPKNKHWCFQFRIYIYSRTQLILLDFKEYNSKWTLTKRLRPALRVTVRYFFFNGHDAQDDMARLANITNDWAIRCIKRTSHKRFTHMNSSWAVPSSGQLTGLCFRLKFSI